MPTKQRWENIAKPSEYNTEHNAIRAVARLAIAAQAPREAPWTLGPKRGLEALERDLQFVSADVWVEQAVQQAVLRSAPGAVVSAKSALRGWAAFADSFLHASGRHLPPTERGLTAWSQCFRRKDTFCNYVSYLRLGCDILSISAEGMDGPFLKRAKGALKKREDAPKETRFIRKDPLRKLMQVAAGEQDTTAGTLYLAAYSLMLRVPSEGLRLVVGGDPLVPLSPRVHSAVAVVDDELLVRLAKRKNRPHGPVLRRACCCGKGNKWACPVHTLAQCLERQPPGSQPVP